MRRGKSKMEFIRVILKIIMWVLIIGFSCNFIMQKISYSFYKNAKRVEDITIMPKTIQINKNLTGFGCNLESNSNQLIILLGGSNYIAYNSIGKFGEYYDCPVISVDYYGTQNSIGKMNIKTMQQSVIDLYEWIKENYPEKEITIIGHSYGAGMAAYLASAKDCNNLILLSAYRDLSDLYNKIIPIFWGPAKIFISNNINIAEYAKGTKCNVYIMGSDADKTLNASLQQKVAECYNNAKVMIYKGIEHDKYLTNAHVIAEINKILSN